MAPELANIFEIASSLPHRERAHAHSEKRKIVVLILREETRTCFQRLNDKLLGERTFDLAVLRKVVKIQSSLTLHIFSYGHLEIHSDRSVIPTHDANPSWKARSPKSNAEPKSGVFCCAVCASLFHLLFGKGVWKTTLEILAHTAQLKGADSKKQAALENAFG